MNEKCSVCTVQCTHTFDILFLCAHSTVHTVFIIFFWVQGFFIRNAKIIRSHHQVPKFKFLDTQTAFALWVSERVSAVQLSRPSLKLKIRVTLCPFKYPKYWLFLEMNCSISTIIMLFSSTKAVWLGLFTNNENWKTI